jgi:hypothetical protein
VIVNGNCIIILVISNSMGRWVDVIVWVVGDVIVCVGVRLDVIVWVGVRVDVIVWVGEM